MKILTVSIWILLLFCSCLNQNESDNENKSVLHHRLIAEQTLSLGVDNSIICFNRSNEEIPFFYIKATKVSPKYVEESYLTRIIHGATQLKIDKISVPNGQIFSDIIEDDSCFYAISTEIRTMNGFTRDFLIKYDKKFKPIWSKTIGHPKFPVLSSTLTLTNKREILIIANRFRPNDGISIYKYNLDGNLISEIKLTSKAGAPVSLIKSNDNCYYCTIDENNTQIIGRDSNTCKLIKINTNNDTLWTKTIDDFSPKQSFLTKGNDLVLYGASFSVKRQQHYLKIIVLDKNGKLKWEKKINKFFSEEPGNMIETNTGNYLFVSDIIPVEYDGTYAYLFELDKNGNLVFEEKYEILCNSIILERNNGILLISGKSKNHSSDPFNMAINVKLLTDM